MPQGHKENCLCPVCKQGRKNEPVVNVAPIADVVPILPTEVQAGSLPVGTRFLHRGETYQAGIVVEKMLFSISLDKPHLGIQTIELTTLVKVIK